MTTCINCNSAISDKYCANCGQPAQLKRIDSHYLSHEIMHLLHFEKGFFYNLKELTLRPGDSIRSYITKNRSKHMKPVAYLILTSLLYTLVAHFSGAHEINDRRFESSKNVDVLFQWVSAHYGYANIMMGIIIAYWVYLIFKKYKYSFFEIVVLLCFIVGHGMLMLAIISALYHWMHPLFYGLMSSFIVFFYAAWAIGQFFDSRKIGHYFKAFLAYFLGYLCFYLLVVAVGLLLDMATTGKIGG